MQKPVIALYLATMACIAAGPFGRRDEPSLLIPIAEAQSRGPARLSCPEDATHQLEERLAPGVTVPITPGYAVSSNKARYLSEDGKVTIDICIDLRRFTEGEKAERTTIEMRGDTGTYVVYLQEKDLEVRHH